MKIHIEADNIEELIVFSRNFIAAAAGPTQVQALAEELEFYRKQKNTTTVPETPSAEPEVIFQEVAKEEPKSETTKAIEEVFEGKVQEIPQGKEITKEDVRAVFSTMLKANLGQDAKILTGKYNAKKVPDIKPEDYEAIYNEALAIIDRAEANEKAAEGATA